MATAHVTFVLLYSSVAGICKLNVLTVLPVVTSLVFSSVNSDPLTIQAMTPVLALQLKVAVDPSVALTDVGVMIKAEIWTKHSKSIQVSSIYPYGAIVEYTGIYTTHIPMWHGNEVNIHTWYNKINICLLCIFWHSPAWVVINAHSGRINPVTMVNMGWDSIALGNLHRSKKEKGLVVATSISTQEMCASYKL